MADNYRVPTRLQNLFFFFYVTSLFQDKYSQRHISESDILFLQLTQTKRNFLNSTCGTSLEARFMHGCTAAYLQTAAQGGNSCNEIQAETIHGFLIPGGESVKVILNYHATWSAHFWGLFFWDMTKFFWVPSNLYFF